MILRVFLIFTVVLLGGTAYFIVIEHPPAVQIPPRVAEVTRFQKEGVIPTGDIEENNEVGHGIFEIPEEDKAMLEAAMANMGNMPGMEMGGMIMAEGETLTMAEGSQQHGAENAESCSVEGGLSFCPRDSEADREIAISMREWEFETPEIEVKAGERIRFTVRNDGQTLHEFMFMTMPLMMAVDYRVTRADWSLLEHEALFEISLLLPGQELTFVVEVQQAGSWMFMCMLPYHMQLGMMGQIATPGAAMDVNMDM